jgi:transcriptional regulator EpsA
MTQQACNYPDELRHLGIKTPAARNRSQALAMPNQVYGQAASVQAHQLDIADLARLNGPEIEFSQSEKEFRSRSAIAHKLVATSSGTLSQWHPMAFLPSFSPERLRQYNCVVSQAVNMRSHHDVLAWLQGAIQSYLPHDIFVASWGDFENDKVQHDVLCTLEGVRSLDSNATKLTSLMCRLFTRWLNDGCKPFGLNVGYSGFLLANTGRQCALGSALQHMRSAMVLGINDARGSHNCLYVTFSARESFSDDDRGALAMILPFVDTALRQVAHLPHQLRAMTHIASVMGTRFLKEHDLSAREVQVLDWISMGKTNHEIGIILEISAFTVKNYVQRMFKNLDVSNRAQADSKLNSLTNHV